MLHTPKQSSPAVKILKLTSGEEIIATINDEDASHYFVVSGLQLAPGRNGMQFVQYLMMSDTSQTILINKATVIAIAKPSTDFENLYKSAISGIALPKQSGIIT